MKKIDVLASIALIGTLSVLTIADPVGDAIKKCDGGTYPLPDGTTVTLPSWNCPKDTLCITIRATDDDGNVEGYLGGCFVVVVGGPEDT